jgi:hypothetical protein
MNDIEPDESSAKLIVAPSQLATPEPYVQRGPDCSDIEEI